MPDVEQTDLLIGRLNLNRRSATSNISSRDVLWQRCGFHQLKEEVQNARGCTDGDDGCRDGDDQQNQEPHALLSDRLFGSSRSRLCSSFFTTGTDTRRKRFADDVEMGVLLTPIVVKETIALGDLRGLQVAVDAYGELYQFLALIRLPDGTPLKDPHGRITSHLSGLFYRTTRLITDIGLRPVFVFDGRPPVEKSAEIARRRAIRERYQEEAEAARHAGDLPRAYSKSTMTSRLTAEMIGDARQLLSLMGLPFVDAPSEAEAQAAHMARCDVWGAVSKDYDTLLFGAPKLVRFLTISGREFLPSQGTSRPITPELIDLQRMLDALGITRAQLIDLGLLVGTDFHPGVRGIGPRKALALVKRHGALEEMPVDIRDAFGTELNRLRQIYLAPEVRDDYDISAGRCDVEGVVRFLCDERAFKRDRVMAALERAFGPQRLF